MQVVLNSEMGGSKCEVKSCAANAVQLICSTKTQHNSYLNPNLSCICILSHAITEDGKNYGEIMILYTIHYLR
jgi:hypothetical protein